MSIKITKIKDVGPGFYSVDVNATALNVTIIGGGGGGGSSSNSSANIIYGAGYPGSPGIVNSKLLFIEDLHIVDGKVSYVVGEKGMGAPASFGENIDGTKGSDGTVTTFGPISSFGGSGGSAGKCGILNQFVKANNISLLGSSGDGAFPDIIEGLSVAGSDGTDGVIHIIEYIGQ